MGEKVKCGLWVMGVVKGWGEGCTTDGDSWGLGLCMGQAPRDWMHGLL